MISQRCLLLLFIIIISAFFIIISEEEKGFIPRLKILNLVDGFFFGIVTMPGDKKQQFTYDYWIKEIQANQTNNKAAFICNPGKEFKDVLYLHPTEKELSYLKNPNGPKKDKDIVLKRYIGAKYFIENTSLKWFWSTSDDCAIDTDKLPYLLSELNRKYNTENDTVLQGQCIYANGEHYMHGGCGYIFSRKAAQLYYDLGVEFIDQIVKWDDFEFRKVRDILNLTIRETGSQYMTGTGVIQRVEDNWHDILPKCPDKAPYTKCYENDMFKLKDFIGFHRSKVEEVKKPFAIIRNASKIYDDIYYYFNEMFVIFCKK